MIQRSLAALIRLATGVRRQPMASLPCGPVVFFANHTSHLDFLSIWAALPPIIRKQTHPIAAKDYWSKNGIRRWLASSVFQAHLIDRKVSIKEGNPIDPLCDLLEQGHSIIIFPEGTRSRDGALGKFKPGLYHLTKRYPEVPLVPVYLENMNRILPAGELFPIPLLGHLDFRPWITLLHDESKTKFLARAEESVQPSEYNPTSDQP